MFLFCWRLMLLWVMAVIFKNTDAVSVKWNVSRVVPRLYGLRSLWQPKKWERGVSPIFYLAVFGVLGGRGCLKFPRLIPVLESFSSELLRAIISYWAEPHLKSCQTSTMELFHENSQCPQHFDYFCQKRRYCKCSQRIQNSSVR